MYLIKLQNTHTNVVSSMHQFSAKYKQLKSRQACKT